MYKGLFILLRNTLLGLRNLRGGDDITLGYMLQLR